MSPDLHAETIATHGCSVVLRRVDGPEALELFLHVQPDPGVADAGAQAEAVYRAIGEVLAAEGASDASVVCEKAFLRTHDDAAAVRSARERVVVTAVRPAATEIVQPPLLEGASVEISVQAIVPRASPLRVETVDARPECGCSECARSHGARVRVGDEVRFEAGGIYGAGDDATEQALAMFAAAEDLLQRADMTFHDVVRTWIHLGEMERDYDALNRARREFFASRGIDPVPASTGIGGGPVPASHDLALGFHALQSGRPLERRVMTTPTLNEAATYGADFVRGMRVDEANRIALHVSGTASIDEMGRTAHPGDLEPQVDRMLVNVAGLLEGQGAGFGDVVSAVTYLKDPADAARLRRKLSEAGFHGFPNALVAAPICRPELLCETEVFAVLPNASRFPA